MASSLVKGGARGELVASSGVNWGARGRARG